ncbi:ATP-dependent metallopeptidase FtsH/Yme1/Tma family protein [Campylobacter fetus]|uniref:ATP-dependent metallopeptidase FtsH/Yme1/Tma family protein n=1 Tax=Campylobacter fetus TaxID=196 RepID=UPI001280110F|nr:ATP-dependent metallopeptidase FtsH/Yme1/Tma family protein [Campylobacter fetus]MPB73248.1 ATP-dependent metallopeptidase FtsH/Yme1/Tma family protein [Campylobacter fetus]MPB77462.1 ATP-dependent metallopeptidase FtsH/Yme1/Tma family protein [Campylobacter fetus]
MKITQKFKLNLNKKIWVIAVGTILVVLLGVVFFRNIPKDISLMQYDNLLQSNSIQSAAIDGEKIVIKAGNQNYYVVKDSINLNELGQKVPLKVSSDYSILEDLLLIVIFIVMFIFGFKYFKKSNLNYKKSSATDANDLNQIVSSDVAPAISNVMFKDVAGINDVKLELMEIVDFLKNPKAYQELSIKMPKGVLMVGPPGVGKTLIAKAVAGEANVPFFYQSGASFVQIYVGMGAKRVRELFFKAKAYAPSIIFIDEIDAVGKARGGGRNDEREATLNQLLTEMDGFTDNSGVIVIAATNKIEMIDEALLRSGRFDRRIFLGLPDCKDRMAILNSYLKDKKHEVDINTVAKNTTGFSGAGLATLVNEAAINAFRNHRTIIQNDDFKAVENRVLYGKKKIYSLSQSEKEIQALYQGAKALSAEWFGVDFDKISLLEDRFLSQDSFLESKTMILSRIKVYLAGSVALKIYKNELYTNSSSDILNARELAKKLVIDYAMTGNLMASNNDIKDILDECLNETAELIKGIQKELFVLSSYLVDNESVDRDTIKDMIRNINES